MHHFGIFRGSTFRIGILIVLFLGVGRMTSAQESQIKKEPIQQSHANSGPEMFKQYCAACHGPTGKGDGPAASALKDAPADLTTLAKRHDGKFPAAYVATVLRNGVKDPAHGNVEMPVWGPLFMTLNGNPAIVDLRIANLTNYVKTLQVK